MDFHKIENVTVEAVKAGHMAEKSIQDKYGVKYHQFWVNEDEGTVFCLTEGPDAETCEMVHRLAHGNVACALTEVEPGFYKLLMGENRPLDDDLVLNEDGSVDLGYRTILVVSVRTIAPQKNTGEVHEMLMPPEERKAILLEIASKHGREIRSLTPGIAVGVFDRTGDALACALSISQNLSTARQQKVIFKIGISASQPVTSEGDFFSKAINLAHCLNCVAKENEIVTSSLVKKLSGDNFPRQGTAIRSFDQAEEEFVFKVLEFVVKNLSEKELSISSLCKHIGMSQPQLYRKTVSVTGRSPIEFIRDTRLDTALALIKKKSGNISEVAMEVGFNSPSYFSKCFQKRFGCNPSELVKLATV